MAKRNLLDDVPMEPDEKLPSGCPPAIKSKAINLKNHRICITKADLGPANPKMPEVMFWLKKSMKWNVSEKAAREMICGNCQYYHKTKAIDAYMKKYEQITPPDVDPAWVDTGESGGYCTEWEITCTHSRTCDSWEPGGPITDAKLKG